jgi:hypothetical protein
MEALKVRYLHSIDTFDELLVAVVKNLEDDVIQAGNHKSPIYFWMDKLVKDYGAPYRRKTFHTLWINMHKA